MIKLIGNGLTQWDTKRSVEITGCTHVRFSNPGDSLSAKCAVENDTVLIPEYLLTTGKPVIIHGGSYTEVTEKVTLPVDKAPRPGDYIYTKDDRNYIYELLKRAEDAADNIPEMDDIVKAVLAALPNGDEVEY